MTDRRPHWTDDLIEAVHREAYGLGFGVLHGDQIEAVCDIIAVVEDYWHDKGWGDITQSPIEVAILYNAVEARAEKAEAALRRVRELPILGKAPQGNTALRGYNDGWNSCRMATLRALDGTP